MSSEKKQNTKLMVAVALIFAVLIACGFVALLLTSPETSSAEHHALNGSNVMEGVSFSQANKS